MNLALVLPPQNTYVLAQAFKGVWQEGDELVLTSQDHESNIGAMLRAAEASGVTVRFWHPDPETGLLNVEDLKPLLNQRTSLVCFHASNITGQKNKAEEIVRLAKAVGATPWLMAYLTRLTQYLTCLK